MTPPIGPFSTRYDPVFGWTVREANGLPIASGLTESGATWLACALTEREVLIAAVRAIDAAPTTPKAQP